MDRGPSRLAVLFRDERVRAPTILFLAGLLALLWKFFGSHGFYAQHFATWRPLSAHATVNAAAYRFGTCFLVFGLVPALVVTQVFRQSLADYGLTFGRWRRALIWIGISVPLFVALGYFGAGDPEYQRAYPINRHADASAWAFAFHATSYFIFYMGWEFFFRGFVLLGLAKPLGVANAIIIQATLSAMLHIGDPASEAFGCFFVGLAWGVAVYRTRTLLPALIGHATLGLSLDFFLSFGQ